MVWILEKNPDPESKFLGFFLGTFWRSTLSLEVLRPPLPPQKKMSGGSTFVIKNHTWIRVFCEKICTFRKGKNSRPKLHPKYKFVNTFGFPFWTFGVGIPGHFSSWGWDLSLFHKINWKPQGQRIYTAGDSKFSFDPLVGGHSFFERAHLTIPKRSQRIPTDICFFLNLAVYHLQPWGLYPYYRSFPLPVIKKVWLLLDHLFFVFSMDLREESRGGGSPLHRCQCWHRCSRDCGRAPVNLVLFGVHWCPISNLPIYVCFLKWRYPTTMGFPTKDDHFGVEIGGTTI